MTDAAPDQTHPTKRPHRRPPLARVALWAGVVVVALAALVAAAILGLNTDAGRGFVVKKIAEITTEPGISVRVGRIDGSLYGRMTIRDIEVRDVQGTFLTAPAVVLDWRPFAYVRRKFDVREISAPTVRMLRKPALKPTAPRPDAPLLPNIDLTVGSLRVDQLILEPAVTGRRHIIGIRGSADLAHGRARLNAALDARQGSGVAGGDRLTIRLDAVPSANRLLIDANLAAPLGGVVDSYTKLGKPLALSVAGRGDWRSWTGAIRARAAGQPLADLSLTAHNGDFRAVGQARPDLVLPAQAARMLTPAVALDLAAVLKDRRAETRLNARSDSFSIAAEGLIDLGRNSFGDFRVDARLLRAGSVAPNLTGRDVRLTLALDGPFARPRIDYDLTAAAIGFGTTTVEGLKASGRTTVDAQRMLVPVTAAARRVTGLNAAAGGLLTNLRIDGTLAIGGGRILSDNLRLRSDRIDATAIVIADLASGRYTGTLKGRVNDYEVAGLGRFDVVTDARVVSGRTGGFGIRGGIRVNTRRLDNAAVRDFLGGNAVVSADVSMNETGVITVANLRLNAPQFRIVQGAGTYQPNGRLNFRVAANSTRYGPLSLTAAGTAEQPVVRLVAPRPNVGVQLTDVVVDVTGAGGRYRVQARGGSPYGPFAADMAIRPGQPLSIDVASARFAGIGVKGALTQTAQGPFAGTLALEGAGLNGTVRLSATGAVQRADAEVTAQNATLPMKPAVTVGGGLLRATAILYPNAPAVTADARLTNVRQGAFTLAAAQARVRYQNNRGDIGLTAQGRSGVPFDIAAQAALTPDLIRANLQGTVNGLALRLRAPAQIAKVGAGWRLAPTTLLLPRGEVQLSGQTGTPSQLQARLRNLDLSLFSTFMPAVKLSGTASGTVDVTLPAGGAVPTVAARLDIARFSRVGLATESLPVDIALGASLSGAGGDVRALIRRGGANLGRLQARLAPLSPGAGPWMQRLMASSLGGGVRYSGPSDVLWALTGITGQAVSGPVAIAADFGGRLNQPTLNGVIRADALRYENPAYGTVISNIAVRGRFTQARLEITSLSGRAGRGTLNAVGWIGLDAAQGFPMDLRATLDSAQLARSDALAATVTGTVNITNNRQSGAQIQGDLRIPDARYRIIRQGAAETPALEGVRRRSPTTAVAARPAAGTGLPSAWKLDIRVRADNRIFVSGMGLEAEWRTDLRLGGTAAAPAVTGELEVVRGTYSFAGRRLELTRGEVTFQGPRLTDPLLNISASTTAEGVTAVINITGRAQNPQITFTSTPALPQDEVLSRLLFGSSVGTLSPTQAVQLAAALNSLRGGGGGLNPLGKLRSATGIDRLRVLGADQASGRGTSLSAGQYITNNIYVEVITDARGFTATQIEIALSRTLSILSQAGSFGGSNFSLRYSRDY